MINDIRNALADLIESIPIDGETIKAERKPERVRTDWYFAEIGVEHDDTEFLVGSRRISYAVDIKVFVGESSGSTEDRYDGATTFYDEFERIVNSGLGLTNLPNTYMMLDSASFDTQDVNGTTVQACIIAATIYNNRRTGA